ncbi:stage V sporulation protein AA [Cohnella nanjingensis]|uniref:Stage V sporulation protein AA n=1 Tax=Cohnella nanjingensis TaxID=1387779 RepID=A0A7X0RV17_9BACL|nr:stage V sporulation protein AA [Cohnella nanjingensis]MBB6674204.1 stage V sporulation protein AA [Cohnella nanjingensis]
MESTDVVYVRLHRRVVVAPKSTVLLGDVASLVTEPSAARKLAQLPIWRIRPEDGNLLMFDMLHVVRRIREVAPQMTIETFGEPHVLLEVAERREIRPRWALLVATWLLLFFGSGMAILNFHADVNMPEVQRRIIELLTGRNDRHPWLFEIPYSLGLGLGMLLFFNRVFRRRLNDEPNPLEVEMFMYQENVNRYVITEEYRKKIGQPEGAGRD